MSALRDDHEHLDELAGGALRHSVFAGAVTDLGEMFRGSETLSNLRGVSQEDGTRSGRSVTLSQVSLPADLGGGDWTKTLTMVERAAATIKAYEKRFLQLEKQSKALADRAAEDQHRLQAHIQSLEDRLKLAEDRVTHSEAATRDAEYHEWEANMREKRMEQRATEAEAKAHQLEAYLRRVHELLAVV